jgi:tetratricopeptide (TPR) repeat protein
MSEQLIREHREFVEKVLGPYVILSQEYIRESLDDKSNDSPQFQLACLLADRHFHSSLRDGTQIIFNEIPQLPHFHEFASDWSRFIDKVRHVFEGVHQNEWIEDGGKFWEAMQYALEISPRLMEEFYALGLRYYSELDRENTLPVMGLISLLNPFLFEPWLVQGILYFQEKKIEMSLFCLSLAAIVCFEHPGPHLYLAQCYLELGDVEQATRSLHLAKNFIDDCPQTQWKLVFEKTEQQIRRA